MTNNAKLRLIPIIIAAVCLPPLALYYSDGASFFLCALVAALGLTALYAVKPSVLWLALPLASYGIGAALGADAIIGAFILATVPLGLTAGYGMYKGYSRAKTVFISVVGLFVGAAFAFVLSVIYMYGALSADAVKDGFNSLYGAVSNGIYENVVLSLESVAASYDLGEMDVHSYASLYVQTLKPIAAGMLLFAGNLIAYVFTAAAKRLVKWVDVNRFDALLGQDEKWLFVLSKSSAGVFLGAYLCLMLGGDTLSVPEQAGFYAVFLAIFGGVIIMGARSVRNYFAQSTAWNGTSLAVILFVLFFIFGSSVLSIAFVVVSASGVVASFKHKKKEVDGQCKK